MTSELLAVEGLSAEWAGRPVLEEVGFTLGEGEFVTLLGPNGAGKTTLLRCLVGLETPSRGSVRLAGRELSGLATYRRGIGLVSQEPSLFPHRTVRENIAYGPYLQRLPVSEVAARVDELLELLELADLAPRYPSSLSGGEQQRVALARSLAPNPRLVLLDEPFASVDPELRGELRGQFREVLARRGTAALHVTHDREEGLFLGARVMILLEGRLAQSGPPLEVFAHPGDARVARFLGYNILHGPEGPFAVLPEELEIVADGTENPATVTASGPVGRAWVVHLRLADGTRLESRRTLAEGGCEPGSRVGLRPRRALRLPPEGAEEPPRERAQGA